MKSAFVTGFVLLVTVATGCAASGTVTNQSNPSLQFSRIESDFKVSNKNGYDCPTLTPDVLQHILARGKEVDQTELHDYFSYSGCSVTGSMLLNRQQVTFSFDYAGLFRLSNGLLIACTTDCCGDPDYPYCGWDTDIGNQE